MYQGPNKQSLQEQLQESPQDIQSRVDSPWRASPDAAGYNEQTTKAIQRLLKLMEKRRKTAPEKGASSMGVLLLGEAGMGKTHLLMRIAQSSDFPCSMAFIRRPFNEDAVMRHIWYTMFEQLRHLRFNEQQEETTQLEEILLRAIAAVTIWQWERQQQKEHNETRERRIQKAKRDPYFLKHPLTHPKNGAKNQRIASKKLRNYFSKMHPKADCSVIDALLKYTFEKDQHKKMNSQGG